MDPLAISVAALLFGLAVFVGVFAGLLHMDRRVRRLEELLRR